MAEDSKAGGSRAVGIAGGGGVGMFLTQLAPLIWYPWMLIKSD